MCDLFKQQVEKSFGTNLMRFILQFYLTKDPHEIELLTLKVKPITGARPSS